MLPAFISFAGVDHTIDDASDLIHLSMKYPYKIEWGFLASERTGRNRYPYWGWVEKFLDQHQSLGPSYKSLHLCGNLARFVSDDDPLPDWGFFVNVLYLMNRVQINHACPDIYRCVKWSRTVHRHIMLQCQEKHPIYNRNDVDWLLDASAGKGISLLTNPIPAHDGRGMLGYAGGINPENVEAILSAIPRPAGAKFWLCMETGVRTDDKFDIKKCEAVMHAVYGPPTGDA